MQSTDHKSEIHVGAPIKWRHHLREHHSPIANLKGSLLRWSSPMTTCRKLGLQLDRVSRPDYGDW